MQIFFHDLCASWNNPKAVQVTHTHNVIKFQSILHDMRLIECKLYSIGCTVLHNDTCKWSQNDMIATSLGFSHIILQFMLDIYYWNSTNTNNNSYATLEFIRRVTAANFIPVCICFMPSAQQFFLIKCLFNSNLFNLIPR